MTASNEANGKEESNRLEVPLIISNAIVLLREANQNLMVTLVKNQNLDQFSFQV